nr:UUP1 family membrane protein [Orrella marina]
MKRLHLPLLILLLVGASLSLFLYKVEVLKMPLTPAREMPTWTVEATIRFAPTGGSVKADFLIPQYMPGFTLLDESFISRGYGLTTEQIGPNRMATWTQRRPTGQQTVYYRMSVYANEESIPKSEFPGPAPLPELSEPLQAAADALLEDIRSRSADIDSFSSLLVREVNQANPNENVAAFLNRSSDELDRLHLIIDLLAGARIPARIVHGFKLGDQTQKAELVPWIEYHNSRQWMPINPRTGVRGFPERFLVWWVGDQPSALSVDRGNQTSVQWSVARSYQDAFSIAQQRAAMLNSRLMDFSIQALPVQTQNTYRILLLVPLGALVIVFLRNIVGIRTFGTFMPVLIALSLRETELVSGMVMFSMIVALGLAIRFYLEHLKLLLVPRLAAVVIIVVILMAMLSILSYNLGISVGLAITLFPMVILAMTIERMSIVWEEHGAGEAVWQGWAVLQ